jgi:hypothetical protein
MGQDQRQRLIALGKEALADALLELAKRDGAADDLVKRMTATPAENLRRFKAKLAALKRSRRFVRWGESGALAANLRTLLQDLQAGVKDPVIGTEMIAAFYETDKGVLGHCDDSSGLVGDVYRCDAKTLFVDYAQDCVDKEGLARRVVKVNRIDDYGVRDALIDCAASYLPKPSLRNMIASFQDMADEEQDVYRKRHWLGLVESLARQLGDAALFEKTRVASWGTPSSAACLDIAQVYLESGNAPTAMSWLEQVPADETFQADKRDRLLFDVLGSLGDIEKQTAVAWRIFRRHRGKDALQDLLTVIGNDRRETVIHGEISTIMGEKKLSLSDSIFLVDLDRMEEAETYLIERAGQLDGDRYERLRPLAETMETRGRHLAATLVHRALLNSILRRGQTKTYPHGVRYLKKLDRLSTFISDWQGVVDHDTYVQELHRTHGRKSSFWSRYGE